MSKFHALAAEISRLERDGLVEIDRETSTMTIVEKHGSAAIDRIIKTGPWGALLLMGALDDACGEIFRQLADDQ